MCKMSTYISTVCEFRLNLNNLPSYFMLQLVYSSRATSILILYKRFAKHGISHYLSYREVVLP